MPTKPKPKRRVVKTVASRAADERRELFVEEYLLTFNITKSAIKAGFSQRSAHAAGSRVLKDPRTQAMIAERQNKTINKLEITRERVMEEMAKLAFSNPLDYGHIENGHFVVDLSKMTREHAAAIAELSTTERGKPTAKTKGKADTKVVPLERSTKLKLHNKQGALDGLARTLGLFKDDGPMALNVTFVIQDPKEAKRA